jgi:hypothetical protein
MKRSLLFVVLGSLWVISAQAEDNDVAARIAASRETVKTFMGELKGELQAAMKAGGPVHAIQACNIKAPEIARRLSSEKGFEVSRTSLRVRNPANAPDAWERSVLEKFEQRKAAGENPGKIEYSEVVTENGKREFRYMKAIPSGALCLTCHGESIAPAVRAKLDELYPEDKATGFKQGDIRGAFSIIQPM